MQDLGLEKSDVLHTFIKRVFQETETRQELVSRAGYRAGTESQELSRVLFSRLNLRLESRNSKFDCMVRKYKKWVIKSDP